MKTSFPGYFPLKRTEYKELWEQAYFVLDANILLNLYRYSDETRDEFLKILKLLGDRLWIPHRAAFEFLENRLEVIGQQEKAYEDALKSLSDIEGSLKNTRQHPFISVKLMGRMTEVFTDAKKELEKSKSDLSSRINSDPVLERIDELLTGKIGDAFDGENIKQLCVEGESRYKKRVPPGYKDSAKGDDVDVERRYGDLIIWKQIIHKAIASKSSVILLLDDRKEDWWQKFRGKTTGPRPELIKEFFEAVGKRFHMYQPDHFLEHAAEHLKEKVNTAAVKELRERQKISDIERIRARPLWASKRYAEWRAARNSYMHVRGHLSVLDEEIRRREHQIAVKKAEATLGDPAAAEAEHSMVNFELLEKELLQLQAQREAVMRECDQLRNLVSAREYVPRALPSESNPSDVTDEGALP